MSIVPRKRIDELIALYNQESSVFDIFVEGPYDKRIFDWFLTKLNPGRKWVSYCVDSIEVPGDLVREYKLSPSNRNEVLALCYEIGKQVESDNNLVGIVDADFDLVTGALPDHFLVLCTDHTCMEMYLFSEALVSKMINLAFNGCCCAGKLFLEITPVLEQLFLIKLTAATLNFTMPELCVMSYIKFGKSNKSIQFKLEDYIHEYLRKGGCLHRLVEFNSKMEENATALTGDPRNRIIGSDFIKLVAAFLEAHVGGKLSDKEKTKPTAISSFLPCCLDHADLKQAKLFTSVLSRMNAVC